MAIYLKIDGIEGDATETNHVSWIAIDSFTFGVSRNVSSRTGATAVREFSAPNLSDIALSKPLDKASGLIFRESVVGNTHKTYQIDITSTGQGSEILLSYKLTAGMVSNYSISSGGDRPMEALTVNYDKVEVTFSPPGGQRSVTIYDISTTKAG
ncbi:MAG: Hcp family type VI secretion system effector [Stellaceae bacterium]